MKRFNDYLEEEYLEESLNTPIEFYMTDDTKMPREIFAAFEIDGIPYGISLVQTKYNKVYALDFYRIVNVKKRFWSFLKPAHVRKSLSTIIKFMESAYPFIQGRVDGIIIELPKSKNSERYISFLGRILKKSYIKKFRQVPILKTTEDAGNYLFMVKQGVKPTSLFKTAAFHKHFKFDPTEGDQIEDKAMEIASEPYKMLKPTVSTKPSEKYAFGAFKVEYVASQEMIDMLSTAAEMHKAGEGQSQDDEQQPQAQQDVQLPTEGGGYSSSIMKSAKEFLEASSMGTPFTINHDSKSMVLSFPHLLATLVPNSYYNAQTGNPTPKFSIIEFKENFDKLPKKVQQSLVKLGIAYEDGSVVMDDENVKYIKATVKTFKNISPESFKMIKTKLKLAEDDAPPPKKELTVGTINIPSSIEALENTWVGGSYYDYQNMEGNTILHPSIHYLMALILPNAYNNIKNLGFDKSKMDYTNLSYAAKQGFAKLPKKVQDALVESGMFTAIGEINTAYDGWQERIETILSTFPKLDTDDVIDLSKKLAGLSQEEIAGMKSTLNQMNDTIKSDKMTLKSEPVSSVAGFDTANNSTFNSGYLGFKEFKEETALKMKSVLSMPSVQKWYNEFDGFDSSNKSMSTLMEYTGSGAEGMNNGLRSLAKSGQVFKLDDIVPGSARNRVKTLLDYFKKAPRLSNGIWVYRNAYKIKDEAYNVGDDYIDAAFLSTSIRSTMDLGSSGGLRLKIYLPAGTPCFPVFDKSNHKSENELVLPACSALKITERYEDTSKDRIMLVCIYMGHAFEELLEKGESGIMIEQKKTGTKNPSQAVSGENKKDYDREAKWLGAPSKDQLDALRKTLKSGKIKLKF